MSRDRIERMRRCLKSPEKQRGNLCRYTKIIILRKISKNLLIDLSGYAII